MALNYRIQRNLYNSQDVGLRSGLALPLAWRTPLTTLINYAGPTKRSNEVCRGYDLYSRGWLDETYTLNRMRGKV